MNSQDSSPELGIKPFEQQRKNQPELNEDFRLIIGLWRNKFKELLKNNIVSDVKEGMINNFLWQEVRYGEELKTKDDQSLYRGYLMVEPKSFPLALAILSEIAEKRKSQGRSTEFKWLLNTEDPDWISKVTSGQWKPKEAGEYPYLNPNDPRITLYADSLEDIQEILGALAEHPQWEGIEGKRAEKFVGLPPRRPGTNSFRDKAERPWRTLNYNDKLGFSEQEANNPQWRMIKEGRPTGAI